jgi:alpha-beta hydrolase superfamily lysophospholipase
MSDGAAGPTPITPPVPLPPGPRRWFEQRWLVDTAIRTDGLEWDQPRVAYTVRPMGVDAIADFEMASRQITKFDDLVPVFTRLAWRRRRLAEAAEAAGHPVTAREHWFHAALLFCTAEWSIFEDTDELVELDDLKNECYAAYGRLADHHVERVDIPLGDKAIPAWLHLPAGHVPGEPLPVVLSCGGMDAPKELNVNLYGDKFLQRGFAVLAFDGPGQGEAPVRGLKFTNTSWIDAGDAIVAWIDGRDELDGERMVAFGLSFGSYWMTQIAATQPRLLGCAVGLVCHEPGGHMIFEQASPTFKARYMWMAGLEHDEEAFDALAAEMDLRPLVERMEVPWLVVGGDADELSPIRWSYDLAARTAGPSSLLIYHQGRHALSLPTPSVALGPQWVTYSADWLIDRVERRPLEERFDFVTETGSVEQRPHPRAAAS